MKRVCNFRSLCIIALTAISTVLAGVLSAYSILASILILSLIFAFFGVLCVIFRQNLHFLLTFIIALVVGAVCSFTTVAQLFNHKNELPNAFETLSGRVERTVGKDGVHKLYLDNLKVDDEYIDGKIVIGFNAPYSNEIDYVRVGDTVSLTQKDVWFRGVFDSGKLNISDIISGVRYGTYVDWNDIDITPGSMTFVESLHYDLKAVLDKNLGEFGVVAYGIMTGNTDFLDSDIRNSYSTSGLAHVLAVSGLHIGFLVSVLSFLLKKLKANKVVRFSVLTVILLLYNIFIGVEASAIRASLMSLCVIASTIFGRRSDSLNNIGFAVSVVLLLMPYSLFDIGFIMSVGCVFAIVLFEPPITKLLSKILPKKLSGVIAVAFSAQLGIFPPMTTYFHTFFPYAIVSNVIAIPLISIIYVVVMILSLLTLALPFMSAVLYLARYLFVIVDCFNNLISLLPYSNLIVYGGYATLALYCTYFIASRFVMLPKKYLVTIACFVVSIITVVAQNVSPLTTKSIAFSKEYKDCTSVISCESGTYIVGDFNSYDGVVDLIEEVRLRKVDALYVSALTTYNIKIIEKCVNTFNVRDIYFSDFITTDNEALRALYNKNIYPKYLQEQNVISAVYAQGDKFVGFSVDFNDEKALLLSGYFAYGYGLDENLIANYDLIRSMIPLEDVVELPNTKNLINFTEYNENKGMYYPQKEIFVHDIK